MACHDEMISFIASNDRHRDSTWQQRTRRCANRDHNNKALDDSLFANKCVGREKERELAVNGNFEFRVLYMDLMRGNSWTEYVYVVVYVYGMYVDFRLC